MLRLCLLGRPQIVLNDHPVVQFVSEKSLALLCYLAVRRGAHTRDSLAGLLWGEMPEDRARANLRMALYNLQQLVPGCLTATRLEVAFNQEFTCWLDVDRLAAAAAKIPVLAQGLDPIDLQILSDAIWLYRGDFLEGLYPEGAPAFEEWLLVERERLRQTAVQICQHLADRSMRHADMRLAIQTLHRMLDIEPWQESAHRQLMLALARSGDTTAALAQYATCRKVLAQGLGIDPMPETTDLAERIRIARQKKRRENLPPQPTPFIGRSSELNTLRQMLSHSQTRLVTLTGPGGIGKTRLALQAAAELTGFFFEGVYFVPVGDLMALEELAPAILDALGVPLYGTENPRQQLHQVLRSQEVLLVLDGFEHLLDAADLLSSLLKIAPDVSFLVTSRQRLNLQWETIFPLEGLEYPLEDDPGALESSSAVQLLIQCCRRASPGFALTTDDRAGVYRLCRVTEGMPLALELAGAWVTSLSLGMIADVVKTSLDLLATDLRDAPLHHRSLRAALEKSWELCPPIEQDAFRKLAIFHGGFDPQAAQQVCGVSPQTLAALVSKSLLRRSPSGRYDLHEMLRQYAAEKLEPEPELRVSLDGQHSRHYAAFLRQCEKLIVSSAMAETLREIRVELENVRAAWRWAAGNGELESLALGLRCLSQFYESSSLFQEGESAFGLAVDCVRSQAGRSLPEAESVLGRLLIEHARFLRALSHYDAALQDLAEVVDILDRHPDPALQAAAHLQWAEVLERQGDFSTAREHYSQALALAQDDPALQGSSHIGLGIIAGEGGDIMEAMTHFHEARRISIAIGDRRGENAALHNQAIAATYLNDASSARQFFQQELVLAQQLGNRRMEMMTLLGLNLIASQNDDFASLLQYSQQALQICQEIGERHEIGTALDGLGWSALCHGNFDDASLWLEQAYRSHTESGNRRGECISRMHLSLLQRTLGDLPRAKAGLEDAHRMLQAFNALLDECNLLVHLSITQCLLDEHSQAQQTALQAVDLARQLGNHAYEARGLTALGRAQEGLGRTEEALTTQRQALATHLDAGQEQAALETRANIILLLLALEDRQEGILQAGEILHFLDRGPLHGLEPFRIYLAAFYGLHAAGDTRIRQVLEGAVRQIQVQSETIHQLALRKYFLEGVPANRTLIRAWEDMRSAG